MSKLKETKTVGRGKETKTVGRGKSPEINLILDQEKQAKSLIEILKRSIVAFDMSMMGAGKTYVASEVALRFGFKNIIVVCPVIVA
jgi:superfamily II DNA or RNA helicase